MSVSLDFYIEESKKIPEICDEYTKYKNCKYNEKYFIMNDDGPLPMPQHCKGCPKICPEHILNKLEK